MYIRLPHAHLMGIHSVTQLHALFFALFAFYAPCLSQLWQHCVLACLFSLQPILAFLCLGWGGTPTHVSAMLVHAPCSVPSAVMLIRSTVHSA